MTQYRINTILSILGKVYYIIESRRYWYCKWEKVSHCFQETLGEIIALKNVLELGGSQYTIYKPSEELKIMIKYKAHKGK